MNNVICDYKSNYNNGNEIHTCFVLEISDVALYNICAIANNEMSRGPEQTKFRNIPSKNLFVFYISYIIKKLKK